MYSKADGQLKIPRELDEQAICLFTEELSACLELMQAAAPFTGSALEKITSSFDVYLQTVADHGPGVKGDTMFFGKKEGVERALDIMHGVCV